MVAAVRRAMHDKCLTRSRSAALGVTCTRSKPVSHISLSVDALQGAAECC